MENKWELLESSNEDREKIWTKNRTFAGDVWFRFRHKPTAIAGLILILVLLVLRLSDRFLQTTAIQSRIWIWSTFRRV